MPSLRVNKDLNSEIYFITCTVKVYSYDEAKQRILKRVADDEFVAYIEKYFDLESSGDEKVEKVYIYAGNTKIASIETEDEEETLVFHHEDHLTGGNVDTDSDGEVVQLLDYFPYGDSRIDEHDENYENDYQFTGKERDEETGLSYYEARYYNSGIARFIARDPWEGDIKDPQSLNKYSYVQNNPLKYRDPNGDEKLTVVIEMPGNGLLEVGHTGIAIDNEYYDYGPQTENGKSITGNFFGAKGGPFWDQSSSVTNDGNASLEDVLSSIQSNKIAQERNVFTVTAEITPEQAQAITNYWNNRNENPGTYYLLGDQCTTTVAESLDKAGLIRTPNMSNLFSPSLFTKGRTLYDRYRTAEPKAFLNYLQKNLKNTQGANTGQSATVQQVNNSDESDDDNSSN
ncbi:RHS repeat-associated core domain-containing protein [Candidatus Gracilibacteria bacterium]|nr:RHS repeat-associated core domain-containing protein [Candidatus Gracilibacteria bacterium]